MSAVVIVGTGLAGYATAREFRKHDAETPLVMVTANDGASYSKPNLSTAMARDKQPSQLVQNTADVMAGQLHADIRTHVQVEAIEPEDKRLRLSDGSVLEAASIVLAIGASQIDPGLKGNAAGEVHAVNDLAAYAQLRRSLEPAARILIIGGGLIGCEFANDWASAGYQVTIIEPMTHPLGRLLPPVAGRYFAERLESAGVRLVTGVGATAVHRADAGYRVEDSNGGLHEADVVVRAIGLQPCTTLAAQAGLTTARGIVVDRWLETSAAGIFALGDCAEVDGLHLPFIMPLNHCARALGATLACDPMEVEYPVMPISVKTPACPVLSYPPPAEIAGAWDECATETGTHSLFRDKAGRARGFALTGAAITDKAEYVRQVPTNFDNQRD